MLGHTRAYTHSHTVLKGYPDSFESGSESCGHENDCPKDGFLVPRVPRNRRHDPPQGHKGKHQGWPGGRGSEENDGQEPSLWCLWEGSREAGLGLASLNTFNRSGARYLAWVRRAGG